MNFKNIFFLLLFFFNQAYSLEIDGDPGACTMLSNISSKYFDSKDTRLSKNMPTASWELYGISFIEDINHYRENYYPKTESIADEFKFLDFDSVKYKRDKKGNFFIATTIPEVYAEHKIPSGAVVLEINNIKSSEIDDKLIIDITYNPLDTPLRIKFFDPYLQETKEVILNKIVFESLPVTIDISEDLIDSIDSKNSKHISNITLRLNYTIYGVVMPQYIKEVGDYFSFLKNKLNVPDRKGFSCSFNKQSFDKLNMYDPEIYLKNQVDDEVEKNSKVLYSISYFDDDKKITISKDISLKNAVFKNQFKFESFPFDAQTLSYEFELLSLGMSQVLIPVLGLPAFSHSSNFINLDEWNTSNINYNYDHSFRGGYNNYVMVVSHTVERNFYYYVTKIIIPVLIILFISWAVFWINPKEIEARLTVSIVCLLSLIAYTFIIDKEIPKLSYLTFLDYIVLVSYIFSVIPTIQSIIQHYFSFNNIDNHFFTDKKFRIYVPVSYFLFLTIIFISIVNNSSNTIKGIAKFF